MPRPRALEIHAGPEARARLLADGLVPGAVDVIVGASGGAKWLALSAMDRVLFPWLLRDRTRPLDCVGSSIGAWRHLCLAQPDPAAASARFLASYVAQAYSGRPSTAEVSHVSRGILHEAIGADGADHVVGHPVLRSHIVAVRARGPWRSRGGAGLVAATAGTAFCNLLHRRTLDLWLERSCFHTGAAADALRFPRLRTRHLPLTRHNLADAAMASGSIPLVADGVHALEPGQTFWDGGMSDYHFEPGFAERDGLVLYPHFYPWFAPGWFDKPLPWRRRGAGSWPRLVLLAPSRAFVAGLPDGRLADWRDMRRFPTAERQRRWRAVADASQQLAEEFLALAEGRGLEEALGA